MATEIPTLDDAAEDYGREQLAAIRDPVRECGGGDCGGLHRSRREPETALAGAQGNLLRHFQDASPSAPSFSQQQAAQRLRG
jgi:hypothetical protein